MSAAPGAGRNLEGRLLRAVKAGFLVLVLGVLVLGVSGCAGDSADAAGAAEDFRNAATGGDDSSACSMLSPHTREEVAAGTSCEDQLASLQLPSEGKALRTERYGRNALVEFPDDTIFLTVSGSGWQVTAAGCTPQGDAPYDCEVGG